MPNKYRVKEDFSYNGIKLLKDTIVVVKNTKVNILGLHRLLDHTLGWINYQNPIMEKFESVI